MSGARGCLTLAALIGAMAPIALGARQEPVENRDGWTIPANAAKELNPIPASPEVTQKGERIYRSKCQPCHGREGRGDGPDSDPTHPAGNLTDRLRAAFNPDGIIFYRVWNGRRSPRMPAFKTDLSKDEVWTVIHFMKTLRK
jgi:mono/diheme cytochrome c family protein